MDRVIAVSQRAVEVAQLVERYYDDHGYGPTVRELMPMLGLTSENTVQHHVRRAIAAGLLQHEGNLARTLRPVRPRCSHGRP